MFSALLIPRRPGSSRLIPAPWLYARGCTTLASQATPMPAGFDMPAALTIPKS